MAEERNQYQITRKDAKNCFVESLSDAFEIGKIHLVFATYDTSKPVGQRQTSNIPIFGIIIEIKKKIYECPKFFHCIRFKTLFKLGE